MDSKIKYSKKELKQANSLPYNKDLLEILLKEEQQYTLDEVEKLVNKFNKRKVAL